MSIPARVTTLLDNDLLARVERLRLNLPRRFTNRSRGEQLAGKGGGSIEFSDYRDYAAGDDLRYLDWNAFARLRRPYLKVYRREEELHLALLVDSSASMDFEGKFERARALAAAFAVMGLEGGQPVSAYAAAPDGTQAVRPPLRSRAGRRGILRFLEDLGCGGTQPLERTLEAFLTRHRGRGVLAIFSDFLTADDLVSSFNRVFSAGLEILAVQVLGPSEIDPLLNGDLRLVDVETRERLDVTSAGDLLAIYQEHRREHAEHLETLCRRRGGRFVALDSQAPLATALLDTLRRRGWIQ